MNYGYCRASTDKQDASPETQKQIINAYCEQRGMKIDAFYVDPDVSGKVDMEEREAGGALWNVLRKGDSVVVSRLDRLARSFIGFALILDGWERKKITLHLCDFPQSSLNPNSSLNRLVIHMLVAFAEYERQLISQRTKEGLHARRARGQRWCRDAPFGWYWVGKKAAAVMVPNYHEQALALEAYKMRLEGHTYDHIRQHFEYGMRAKMKGRSDKLRGKRKYGVWHSESARTLVSTGFLITEMQKTGEDYITCKTRLDKEAEERKEVKA